MRNTLLMLSKKNLYFKEIFKFSGDHFSIGVIFFLLMKNVIENKNVGVPNKIIRDMKNL